MTQKTQEMTTEEKLVKLNEIKAKFDEIQGWELDGENYKKFFSLPTKKKTNEQFEGDTIFELEKKLHKLSIEYLGTEPPQPHLREKSYMRFEWIREVPSF